MKHAYVDARYNSKYAITNEELTQFAVHVRDLRDRVERICRERIASMAAA